jgi:hypothetical protein
MLILFSLKGKYFYQFETAIIMRIIFLRNNQDEQAIILLSTVDQYLSGNYLIHNAGIFINHNVLLFPV